MFLFRVVSSAGPQAGPRPGQARPEPQALTDTVEMPERQERSITDILKSRDRVATATRSTETSRGRSKRVIKA